jgi:hypothetical protein
MGLDTFGQSYTSLKLVELNSGSIFKGFHLGPESRYTNKFDINRFEIKAFKNRTTIKFDQHQRGITLSKSIQTH